MNLLVNVTLKFILMANALMFVLSNMRKSGIRAKNV
jgi:hypothetical protein